MGVRVLVPLAEGFEEIEAITVIDVLRRAGVEVVAAGLKEGVVRASRGVVVQPDCTLEQALAGASFDAVVLPGGMPGAKHLAEDPRVRQSLERTRTAGGLLGAICAAPAVVLQPFGFLDGKRATCHPNFASQLGTVAPGRVVTDGRLVTSRGPGTALEFALELVAQLLGQPKADEVAAPMVVRVASSHEVTGYR